MRISTLLLIVITFLPGAHAQPQTNAPAMPSLMTCGVHGDIEILCGTIAPEDLELTPDGKYLIATQYLNQGRGNSSGAGMALFDPAKKTFSKMAIASEPDKSWGDPACPGPIGDALLSHGSSLLKLKEAKLKDAKRKDGPWALYVVNHGGRESIEMFELRKVSPAWTLVWHGCQVGIHPYNDVAILPDGGFVGSYPSGLAGANPPAPGGPTGYVTRWTPGKGESEVPNTRVRGPNGVSASADGRYLYVNEFSARTVHKLDLTTGAELDSVMLDFLPDNLTWTKQGHLLAAGVKGARGDCPTGSGRPCIQGFGIAEIDPAQIKQGQIKHEKMTARTIFDSATTAAPLISSVSVAFQIGNAIYVGAFQGDRLVKIPYKK